MIAVENHRSVTVFVNRQFNIFSAFLREGSMFLKCVAFQDIFLVVYYLNYIPVEFTIFYKVFRFNEGLCFVFQWLSISIVVVIIMIIITFSSCISTFLFIFLIFFFGCLASSSFWLRSSISIASLVLLSLAVLLSGYFLAGSCMKTPYEGEQTF